MIGKLGKSLAVDPPEAALPAMQLSYRRRNNTLHAGNAARRLLRRCFSTRVEASFRGFGTELFHTGVLKSVTVHPQKLDLEIFELQEFLLGSQNRKEWLPGLDSN